MCTLKRPDNLSDGAWAILQAVYKNYESDSSDDPHSFDDFSQFNFSFEDLYKYCEELHNSKFVFFEDRETDQRYLYMLPNILSYVK